MASQDPYDNDLYKVGIDREAGARPSRRREAAQAARKKKSTPLLLRFLSWTGVILMCFVLGYLGMSWLVNSFLNKQSFLKENIVENQADLVAMNEAKSGGAVSGGDNVRKKDISLYYVKGDTIAAEKRSFVVRTQEDNIRDAVKAVFSMSGMPDVDNIKVLHVFRNAETAFLDLSSSFSASLSSMGQRQSLLLLTGLVRTMQENFSPIVQVRFLIDSKSPAPGGPIDLTVPWKMPSHS